MRIRKIYKTRYGYCSIIKKIDSEKIIVKFASTGYEAVTTKSHLLRQEVKDYLYPSVCGIGYLGEDYKELRSLDKELCCSLRDRWKHMLTRCYNKKHPSYKCYGSKGVHVSKEWLNFSNFFRDVQTLENWDRGRFLDGELTIDKDYYQPNVSNKVYSKETCIWLTSYEQQQLVNYDDRRKEILAIFPNGDVIKFNGIRTFAKKYHLNEKNVSACLNGKRNKCSGIRFKFV